MAFDDFARAHGLLISDLTPMPKIRRCGTVDKPRSKNGAYMYDGHRGWVLNWQEDLGGGVHWWNNPDAKPWTQADRDAWKKRQQEVVADRQTASSRAALLSEQLLSQCELLPHPYLESKGHKDMDGLVKDDILYIPMRDCKTNRVLGVQRIRWLESERKYEKKMSLGMRSAGAVAWLGERSSDEIFLCEGYATGLSIYAAIKSIGLRAAVLVCFSAGNLVYVTKHLDIPANVLEGNVKAYVFADNDESGTGERAARETKLPYAMAEEVGWDANDIHVRSGLMRLVGILMSLRRASFTC